VGLSYRKSFKAGPFRVTASKSGISYSAGVKGARVTKRANGRVQTTLSVPRTGVRHTTTSKAGTARPPAARRPAAVKRPATVNRAAPLRQPVMPLPGLRFSLLPMPPPAGTRPLPFRGYRATVTLHPGWIQINRTFAGRLKGDRSSRILWRDLVGVDFLDPTGMANGHVHFATAGDPRGLTATGHGDRMIAAARNPHTIIFTWPQRAIYGQLRGLLMANAIPAASGSRHAAPSSRSVADELTKLYGLCQQGVLTPAEFQQAKARLLGQ
jgi:Protein of unknown function (DUF4236)/Short C-terminal domain